MGLDFLHSFVFACFWAGQPSLPPGPTYVDIFTVVFYSFAVVAGVVVGVVTAVAAVVAVACVGVFACGVVAVAVVAVAVVAVACFGVYFDWRVRFMLCAFCF